ncbi:ATP-binding protein [candidate division WOR-3 bacterium]|nr:ATP-binding protein [candidate division WOR-3 bacterium]
MDRTIKTILLEWQKRRLPAIISRDTNLLNYIKIKPVKIIVITGFRRVGKTYAVLHLIEDLLIRETRDAVVYLNFEDERIPNKTEFLTALLPAVKQLYTGELRYLFLDEIQGMPAWSKWLRRIYDTENIRIFVSGSSSKMSSREIPTELRGRFLEIKIFPLSLKEFLHFKQLDFDYKTIDYLAKDKAKLLKALSEYVKYGGLPEIVLAEEEKKSEIAHSYFQTVIRQDIIERHKVKNEEALKAALRLLINSTGYSISKIYKTLKSLHHEIGKATLQRYIAYIENSYFMVSLPIFSYKMKDQMQYARKVYFIDNIFINSISTKFSDNLGRLYENMVAVELLRRQSGNPAIELYYWKNALHEEVDFVIKRNTAIDQLIQVCYDIDDPDTKKRELRALVKAGNELKCRKLMVITEDHEGTETFKKKQIQFVPLWKWLLNK